MADRVLNFSEFADKYSDDEELDVNDVAAASSNFEEGFDDASYDSPEIKPNRPVEDGESSIPSPDEEGAPSFTSDVDSGMVAPEDNQESEAEPESADSEETEDEENSPIPPVDFDEDGGNPEEEDEEEESEDEEDEEEDSEEDKEDEEEETNESFNIGLLESFESFIKSSN